jgi:hypothetical protein
LGDSARMAWACCSLTDEKAESEGIATREIPSLSEAVVG